MNPAIQARPAGASFNTRQLWAAVIVLGIAVLAMGASLVYVQTRPVDGHTAAALEPLPSGQQDEAPAPDAGTHPLAVTTVAPGETLLTPAPAPAVTDKPALVQKPRPPAASVPKAAPPTPQPQQRPAAAVAAPPVPAAVVIGTVPDAPMVLTDAGPVASRPLPAAPRAICASCGHVESVTAIARKGEAKGVGAVAGGVLGAVVGNQIGKGNGRALATIVGAVGGGVAGNAIEKNVATVTVYQVQVRMEDGSLRMVEQGSAPAIGSAVIVEAASVRPNDGSLHPGNGAAAMAPAAPQAKVYSTDGR
jgi:outer membrane lipoprotein SlyB